MLSQFTLEGHGVRLEPLALDHAEGLAKAAAGDRDSYGYTWVPDGTEDARAYVELALTGRDLSGAEGYRLGYVNRLVANQDELQPAAEEIARRMLQMPPLGIRNNVRICRAAKNLATSAVWDAA